MRRQRHHPGAVVVLVATAIGAASSCGTPHGPLIRSAPARDMAGPTAAADARVTARPTIEQIGHGHQARFATCMPPACPKLTPKTLAVDDSAAGPPIAAAPISAPATAPVTTPVTDAPERLVTDVVVSFAFGSAALTPSARAAIDAVAGSGGIRRIDIRGRTDNVGPAAVNDVLARQRAAAVAQHLRIRHPQLAEAVWTLDAQGACCYAAPNDTPAGRARNRRVEISFGRDPSDL